MNIRVLDKMIRLPLNSLYILQKMLFLFLNGGFLLMILNAHISLMLTGHASQVHLMTIMNLLPPAPFSLMNMNLLRKLKSSVSTFVLQMQLKSDDAWFTLTSAVTTLCVSLTSASVQLPATAASTQSSPQPTQTTSPAIRLSAVSVQSLRQLPLYSVLTRGICIFCRGRWWRAVAGSQQVVAVGQGRLSQKKTACLARPFYSHILPWHLLMPPCLQPSTILP